MKNYKHYKRILSKINIRKIIKMDYAEKKKLFFLLRENYISALKNGIDTNGTSLFSSGFLILSMRFYLNEIYKSMGMGEFLISV